MLVAIEQRMDGRQMADDHDDQGLEKEAITIHLGATTAGRCWGSQRTGIGELDEGNQERGTVYHEGGYVGGVVLDHAEPLRWTAIWRGLWS